VTPAARALAMLPPARCVWPQGEPEEDGFHWCGALVDPGRPYCCEHVERAIERKDEAKAA
jgi:GcrA cell cycle regulator